MESPTRDIRAAISVARITRVCASRARKGEKRSTARRHVARCDLRRACATFPSHARESEAMIAAAPVAHRCGPRNATRAQHTRDRARARRTTRLDARARGSARVCHGFRWRVLHATAEQPPPRLASRVRMHLERRNTQTSNLEAQKRANVERESNSEPVKTIRPGCREVLRRADCEQRLWFIAEGSARPGQTSASGLMNEPHAHATPAKFIASY